MTSTIEDTNNNNDNTYSYILGSGGNCHIIHSCVIFVTRECDDHGNYVNILRLACECPDSDGNNRGAMCRPPMINVGNGNIFVPHNDAVIIRYRRLIIDGTQQLEAVREYAKQFPSGIITIP